MKISIITPCHNSAATLSDTLQSILEQSYADIESIVIDGNSTDGTQEIIKQFEPLFQGRMKWVSESDHGLYDAINKGISLATGDVVGILNSDDFFTSADVLHQVAEHLEDAALDAVYGDVHFVSGNDLSRVTRYYSSKPFRPAFLRFGFMPAHPSFYVRKVVYEKSGPYRTDFRIASDYEMMVRLFRKVGIKSKYLPVDFVTMRTGGLSTRNMMSRWIILKEDVRACRINGIYSNMIFASLKYIYKVFEFRF